MTFTSLQGLEVETCKCIKKEKKKRKEKGKKSTKFVTSNFAQDKDFPYLDFGTCEDNYDDPVLTKVLKKQGQWVTKVCYCFFLFLFLKTTVLSHWDFSHGKFKLLSPGKAGCNRVALPNLLCMLGVLVIH